MIVGTGIDIVKNERLKDWLVSEKLLERFFHPDEVVYVKEKGKSALQSLAARFAAKEAFAKALGTGFKDFSLKEICVKNSPSGKPDLFVYGNALEAKNRIGADKIHLSLSHESEYTIAMVILEKTGD